MLMIPLSACGPEEANESESVSTSAPITTIAETTATTAPTPTGRPVVIDTDVAVEGMMSVLYLVGREDLDIRAITVSGTGLVHCEEGVTQVLGLLEMVDGPEIPVACGPETPLEGFNAFPTSWRQAADSGYGLELSSSRIASELSAPELIASTIAGASEPVTIYADGPQTNLASALRLDPSIAENTESVYLMGGAIDVPGNSNRNERAEWNMWVDPLAADEVFRSGIPITLVPLDATNQVPLHVFHLRALEDHLNTPAAKAVATMLEGSDGLSTGGLFFWDQLTAALLVDESYGTSTKRNVEVVLDEDRSVAGITIEAETGTSVSVIDSVDRERFETEFLSAIAGEDVGPIVVDPDWSVTFDGATWSSDVPSELQAGEYVVRLTSSAEGDAGVAFGWLIDDATPEDMDAWEGISQPPFYELESFVYVAPGADLITTVSMSAPQEYLLVGLDVAGNEATRFAQVDVSE
jgi:inosine-uridine nucleoside N-ribohydrolase